MKTFRTFPSFLFLFFTLAINPISVDANQSGSKNLITDIAPQNADGTINAVIEIPAGTNEKWEVTKPDGILELERKKGKPRIIKYLGYPGNYGMVPRTSLPKELGGDGDPLDILVIGKPLRRGSVAQVKIIGVLKFLDKGEQDDKLIAVLPGTAFYAADSFDQLNQTFPGVMDIIRTWFLYYKGSGKMIFKGYGSKEEAEQILNRAIKYFRS